MSSGAAGDGIRVVIDEASFDFRRLSPNVIEEYLHSFTQAVGKLRDDSVEPRKPPEMAYAPCTDEDGLYEYLWSDRARSIDPETRRDFFVQIGNCPDWDESAPSAVDVSIEGSEPAMALSVGFALWNVRRGHGVSCLVFGVCGRAGFLSARDADGEKRIFFFADAGTLKEFWRDLYTLEKVPEAEFLTLTSRAFPSIDFCAGLTFRRFETTQGLMADVIRHLAVLNDHFMAVAAECKWEPEKIQARLRPLGIAGVSRESTNTRHNDRLMHLRDVLHQGREIRCEWHTKIELHRNRIHFAFGEEYDSASERIFVGIFVRHLPA